MGGDQDWFNDEEIINGGCGGWGGYAISTKDELIYWNLMFIDCKSSTGAAESPIEGHAAKFPVDDFYISWAGGCKE